MTIDSTTRPLPRARSLPWRWLFVLWTVPGLLQFLQEFSYGRTHPPERLSVWRALLSFLPAWYPWIGLTFGVVALTRRLAPARVGWTRRCLGHAAGCVLAGSTHLVVLGLFRTQLPPADRAVPSLPEWIRNSLWTFQVQGEVLAYIVVVALTLALEAQQRAHERDRRATRLEGQLASARVAALQGQLRPHFLFNTLNAIKVMMREDVAAAEQMLLRLSGLLRLSLETETRQCVPLEVELGQLDLYLGIEALRFSDRLQVAIEVEPEVEQALVPTLLLQPLVENALRHGLAPRAAGGRVAVKAWRDARRLRIEVLDDGVGVARPRPGGVGLTNTAERLRELYGEAHELRVEPAQPSGTRVSICMPLNVPGEEASRSTDE